MGDDVEVAMLESSAGRLTRAYDQLLRKQHSAFKTRREARMARTPPTSVWKKGGAADIDRAARPKTRTPRSPGGSRCSTEARRYDNVASDGERSHL